jgi:hypothetical protein
MKGKAAMRSQHRRPWDANWLEVTLAYLSIGARRAGGSLLRCEKISKYSKAEVVDLGREFVTGSMRIPLLE